MYEFLRGPMMWVAIVVCILGLIYQAVRLIRITQVRDQVYNTKKTTEKGKGFLANIKRLTAIFSKNDFRVTISGTILGNQPFLAILTVIFHICIIITPLFLMGHNVLIFQSWDFSLWSFSESISDILTIIFLVSAFLFLMRRIFIAKVRSVTTILDYLLLLITIAPFLTGYLAYHQLIDYGTIINIHIIAGELMLMSIGLTKLGHMIFFFFVRFFIGSEYSLRSGAREWK